MPLFLEVIPQFELSSDQKSAFFPQWGHSFVPDWTRHPQLKGLSSEIGPQKRPATEPDRDVEKHTQTHKRIIQLKRNNKLPDNCGLAFAAFGGSITGEKMQMAKPVPRLTSIMGVML